MKKLELVIRKLLLTIFLFFCRRSRSSDVPVISQNSRILFIRLNRIGDALVATPLIKAVKDKFNCQVHVLASTNNHFIFNNSTLADEVIVFQKGVKNFISTVKKLNRLNYDVVVDLHDDVSSTVSYLIAFIESRYKFGLNKSNHKIFTHVVERIDSTKFHVVERLLELSKLFSIAIDNSKTNIVYRFQRESEFVAKSFIENNSLSKKFLIGINISAGSVARFWGVEKYKQLISQLSRYDINLLLLCDENDLKDAQLISNGSTSIYFQKKYDSFCAMIANLDLLITPDTSIVHIASAYEVPVFGLYVKYKTVDKIWSPYKSDFDCVVTEDSTLNNISFETVKQKFIPFFEKIYYGSKN